jgi:hypothetical protein
VEGETDTLHSQGQSAAGDHIRIIPELPTTHTLHGNIQDLLTQLLPLMTLILLNSNTEQAVLRVIKDLISIT